MLRRILLSVPILLCLSFSTASAEHWVQLQRLDFGDDIMTVSVDTDSIERDGDTATAWTRVVGNSGYSLSKKKYYKNSRTFTFLYNKTYINGQLFSDGPLDTKPQAIEPNRPDEYVYDLIW